MEEASKAKKAKKGFMTPERKKKLRLLLRKKAAEELKKEQERKAAERRRIIEERCGKCLDVDNANEGLHILYFFEVSAELIEFCKLYHDKVYALEVDKYDLEYTVKMKHMEPCCVSYTNVSAEYQTICTELWKRLRDLEEEMYDLERLFLVREFEIADLNSQVNDLRGKFVKPTLKKVSKYENKFAKLQKKAAEFNFRNQLKVVKKKEFTMEEEEKEKKGGIVDWSKKDEEKKKAADLTSAQESVDQSMDQTGGSRPTTPGETASEASELTHQDEPPPPPPPPPKTEEDLWLFLKEAITSANPMSMEELTQKLIDTVTHVPPDFLEPVVEASIKRSQSMEQLASICKNLGLNINIR
ncbi:hypothetical protein AAG570_002868 [Ranatra chinensis]|uniref:Uncharacterized protein n=1 Tax=Ranatra chinensis TaxID=642074 RepID=A0ABD0Y540_9HEMI